MKAVRADAAEWVAIFREGPGTEEERRRFVDWLQESPIHVAEYLEIASIWQDVGGLGGALDVELAPHDASSVVELLPVRLRDRRQSSGESMRGESSGRRPGFWPIALAAASLALLAVTAWLVLPETVPEEYQTGIGEQRSLPLEDGSIVSLNTQSKVRIDLDDFARRIELVAGEALFDVAHDPDRPFIVTVGSTEIRAVGTSFNVYRHGDNSVAVTVLEGRVAVRAAEPSAARVDRRRSDDGAAASVELGIGEQAHVTRALVEVEPEPVDVERVMAWTERRLIFKNARLADVVNEFNRYNASRLEVRDPELAELRLGGTFQAHDPDSLLEFLEGSRDIRVRVLMIGPNRRLLVP